MSDSSNYKGHCLCGTVEVEATEVDAGVGVCHCDDCRRWTGGPFLAVDCGIEVSFKGEDSIRVFDSSEWAERGFCSECGTHLFYRLKQTQQYIMPVGLFDDLDNVVLDHEIFIEQKPDYYHFANDTKKLTGEEVFAAFSEAP